MKKVSKRSGISEFIKLDIKDMMQRIVDLQKELFNLLMQLRTDQLKNTSQIRIVRRDIARVKTVLNERISGK